MIIIMKELLLSEFLVRPDGPMLEFRGAMIHFDRCIIERVWPKYFTDMSEAPHYVSGNLNWFYTDPT